MGQELTAAIIATAVLDNDANYIEEILRGMRLPEKIAPTAQDQEDITTILGFTANLARRDKLSKELAEVVIDLTSIAIDIVKFIELSVGGSKLVFKPGVLKSLVDFYVSDNAAVVRYIYKKEIIPPDIMFAYMGLCLLKGEERHRAEDVEEMVKRLLL